MAMEKKIQSGEVDLENALARLRIVDDMKVRIPKFKVESDLEMNEPLKKVGCSSMLDEKEADLSLISKNEKLSVSKVLHLANIEVNEEGADAAASGVITLVPISADFEEVPEFNCNRPFYFMIRERSSGLTLFSGRVENPLVSPKPRCWCPSQNPIC